MNVCRRHSIKLVCRRIRSVQCETGYWSSKTHCCFTRSWIEKGW